MSQQDSSSKKSGRVSCSVSLVLFHYHPASAYSTELKEQADEQKVSIGLAEYPTCWPYKRNCKNIQGNYLVTTLNRFKVS